MADYTRATWCLTSTISANVFANEDDSNGEWAPSDNMAVAKEEPPELPHKLPHKLTFVS